VGRSLDAVDAFLPSPTAGQERGFRRIVWLLATLVVAPTALLLVVGILLLVLWRSPGGLVLGVLVMALVVCLVTGSVIALILLRREARLSRLQTDFVSKVSHELKTPLTSILMFSEMASDEALPERERAVCLDGIQREALRLRDRIERLLEWGRMEAGQRAFRAERLDPAAIVSKAVKEFRRSARGRDVPVSLEIGGPLPQIAGDPAALEDAMLNLLENAAKYTGEEKRIAAGAVPDGKTVRLYVRDNGRGVPRREQKRIFQKFYRIDDRLARTVEGTGLGLAIVHHVAAGHGGRVEVESRPGAGSTFALVLPALPQGEAER